MYLNVIKIGNKLKAKFKAMTSAPQTITLDEFEYFLIDEERCVGYTDATYIRELIQIDKRSLRRGKAYKTNKNV